MASNGQMWNLRLGRALQVPVLALVQLSIGGAGTGEAEDGSRNYTQWRGPHRDGSASAFVEPARWSEELERNWKVDVGQGYATPLVIGDVVYSFVRREGREVVAALDVRTGEELWNSGYAAPYVPGEPAAAHGAGPKATPVYRDGMLFTLGISGIVAAFDVDSGKLLWRTAGPEEPPFYGAASSPLAGEGIVVAHPGNYGPLTAFDARTAHGEDCVDCRTGRVLRLADSGGTRRHSPGSHYNHGQRNRGFLSRR